MWPLSSKSQLACEGGRGKIAYVFLCRYAAAPVERAVVKLVVRPFPRLAPLVRELHGVAGPHREDLGLCRCVHVAATASHRLRVVCERICWVVVVTRVPVLVGGVELFEWGRLVASPKKLC